MHADLTVSTLGVLDFHSERLHSFALGTRLSDMRRVWLQLLTTSHPSQLTEVPLW